MSWNFDARQFEPQAGIETWPLGKWPVVITASEEKPIKGDKPGFFWQLTIKGIDGPVKDKTQFIRVNHKNASQQAMDIAHRTMSAICYATGVLQFNHPNMLHNIPFLVEAEIRKSDKVDSDGNPVRDASGKIEQREQNEFRNFFNMQGISAVDLAKGVGGAPQQQQQFQPQPSQQAQPQGQWNGQQGGGQQQQPAQGGGFQQQPPQEQQPQNNGQQAWQGGGQQTQQAPQQAPGNQSWQQNGGGQQQAPQGGSAPWGPK